MCLIGFNWNNHPRYRLIFIANRDEFYKRPTTAAHYWTDTSQVLAGRDLEAGGTWMGISLSGQFTALTNYRDPQNIKAPAPSRGMLTANYLWGQQQPEAYLENLLPQADEYNGFNLLVGNVEHLYYFSNYENKIRQITPGLYGLSNHLLDTPWYKVVRLKEKMALEIQKEEPSVAHLLNLLHDLDVPTDDRVQQTGLSLEWERMLAPLFIQSNDYGTHSSSAVLIDHQNRVSFTERKYAPRSEQYSEQHFTFTIQQRPD
ncbi:MAG: NRDE family protein [Bacteroidia bacterium]|nr:NRDE family protein [Bacteroidia bacterium]